MYLVMIFGYGKNFCQIPFYKRASLVISPRGKEVGFLDTCSFKNIDTDTILN